MQSNPLGVPFRTKDSWDQTACEFYDELDCEHWDCEYINSSCINAMRTTKTSDELLKAQTDMYNHHYLDESCVGITHPDECDYLHAATPWTPTVETQPLFAFQNGDYNKNVPIVIGTNQNEGIPFTYFVVDKILKELGDKTLDHKNYVHIIYRFFNYAHARSVVQHYAKYEPGCNDDHRILLSAIVTDFLFVCPTRFAAQHISAHSNVWVYHYNHFYKQSEIVFKNMRIDICADIDSMYVCHGDELPIVFGSDADGLTYTDKEKDLSKMIQAYWTNVAKSNNPGRGANGITWTQFTESAQETMVFHEDTTTEMQKDVANTYYNCTFWDSMGYPWLKWEYL
eukprot:26180_1